MRQRILIIGIGNTLRRDDGAGPFLAERLAALLSARGLAVEWLAVQQLTPELAALIEDTAPTAVFMVDAAAGVDTLTVAPVESAAEATAVSHSLAPATLLYMARRLYGWSGSAWVVQVPASDFAHGEGFSSVTQRALDQAGTLAGQLVDLLYCGV